MKLNYPEDFALLHKGEAVTVVGASHRRGHLIVKRNGTRFDVPFQFTELVINIPVPINI